MARAKKSEPTVTHTKIICRAIKDVEREIDGWKQKLQDKAGGEELLEEFTADLRAERDVLYQLYKIETGVDY